MISRRHSDCLSLSPGPGLVALKFLVWLTSYYIRLYQLIPWQGRPSKSTPDGLPFLSSLLMGLCHREMGLPGKRSRTAEQVLAQGCSWHPIHPARVCSLCKVKERVRREGHSGMLGVMSFFLSLHWTLLISTRYCVPSEGTAGWRTFC